ncbi:MAG: DUF4382 domain-containing protein [Ferruginibacter sp.]|nr:DUF4382 domain-containing protein [Ferruginibacter sp.]
MKKNIIIVLAALLTSSIFIASCSKDNNEDKRSTLNVRLTDAPTAYEEVNVDISEVRVKFSDDSSSNGWVTLTTNPGIYNLLAYQNGVDTLLGTGIFPLQVLKEIRFVLGPNNTIKDSGVVYPLTIPSGSESGLKIKVNKSLNATLETIIIDFDAALSVHKDGTGDYKLRPVLKVK